MNVLRVLKLYTEIETLFITFVPILGTQQNQRSPKQEQADNQTQAEIMDREVKGGMERMKHIFIGAAQWKLFQKAFSLDWSRLNPFHSLQMLKKCKCSHNRYSSKLELTPALKLVITLPFSTHWHIQILKTQHFFPTRDSSIQLIHLFVFVCGSVDGTKMHKLSFLWSFCH